MSEGTRISVALIPLWLFVLYVVYRMTKGRHA